MPSLAAHLEPTAADPPPSTSRQSKARKGSRSFTSDVPKLFAGKAFSLKAVVENSKIQSDALREVCYHAHNVELLLDEREQELKTFVTSECSQQKSRRERNGS